MSRAEKFRINQRLAMLEARLNEVDTNPSGPYPGVPLEYFTDWRQLEFLKAGKVYQGKVYA
jgi:hypothetical protein